jgi:hypothetical protein
MNINDLASNVELGILRQAVKFERSRSGSSVTLVGILGNAS